MNDSTEHLMKKWRPRPPSTALRKRIFGPEPAAPARARFGSREIMGWLAPAVGCFALVTATFTNPVMRAPSGAMEPLGEQHLAFSMAAGHSGWNNVPATTLEWTFRQPSSSSNDSFVRTETNTLIK